MFDVTLPRPPSVNALFATDFRTKRRFQTKAYSSWISEAERLLLERPYIEGKVSYIYDVGREPDKRRRDLTNYSKAIEDFLVRMKIIEDDSFIQCAIIRWSDKVPAGYVRIQVFIYEEEKE